MVIALYFAYRNTNSEVNKAKMPQSQITHQFLAHPIRISEILPWDRNSYFTHAILPVKSSYVTM